MKTNNKPCAKTIPALAGMALIALFAAPASLKATDRIWVPEEDGLFNVAGNWDPSGVPGANDYGFFAFTSNIGQIEVEFDLTFRQVLRFGVGAGGSAANRHANVLLTPTTSGTLTVSPAASSSGALVIGGAIAAAGTAAGNNTGILTLDENMTLQLRGSAAQNSGLHVGTRSGTPNNNINSTGYNGSLILTAGSALEVGTDVLRVEVAEIGVNKASFANDSGNPRTSTGSISATTGGTFTAYMGDLSIGTNIATLASAAVENKGVGTVNFANFTTAWVNANTLQVGVGTDSVEGTFNVAGGTLLVGSDEIFGGGTGAGETAAGTVRIGAGNTGSIGTQSGTNAATGSVTFGTGSRVVFGQSAERRADVRIGYNESTHGSTITRSGTLTTTGGEFSGYMSSLSIGSQNATTVGKTYGATGVVDLRNTSITTFDVSGNAVIGNGAGAGSHGTLRLSEVNGQIGGDLLVGDDEGTNSSGLLDLVGTRLEIGGDASILNTGRVQVTVSGNEAGLVLSSISTLLIETAGTGIGDSNAGYFINFQDPSEGFLGLYYGLAWEGDHLAALNNLASAFYITWENNMTGYTPGVFYDSGLDLTYVGVSVVPEPSTWALLALGLMAIGFTRRRAVTARSAR